jgi:exopolysaccharide biosynthesis polyprenyl glycosylphosphotransferase
MLASAGLAEELASSARVSAARVWVTIAFPLLTLLILVVRGMYGPPPYRSQIEATRGLVTGTAFAAAILVLACEPVANSPSTIQAIVRTWIFDVIFLGVGRISLGVTARRTFAAGGVGSPTLIVGAGKVGRLVAKRLLANPQFGLTPVGYLDKEPLFDDDEKLGIPVVGASWDLERVVRDRSIEHVIVAFSTAPSDVLLRLLKRCEELHIRTSFVPRLYERSTERMTVQTLGGIPLVSSRFAALTSWQRSIKHAMDRIAAAMALVLLSPIMLILALVVWISMGRPILYRQGRVGRDDEEFQMLKFRSMRTPAAAEELVATADTAPGGVGDEDRRTRIGAIMRRTSLDELPQLLNVVKGEMSLVGPRPERPEFVDIFERTVYRYGDRHRVKAGITGWAQVCGFRGKTSLADRIEWDNHYIENWSLWFDVKILLMTLIAVTRIREVE